MITFSPVIDYLMDETRRKPTPGHDALLFSISGTGYLIMLSPVADPSLCIGVVPGHG